VVYKFGRGSFRRLSGVRKGMSKFFFKSIENYKTNKNFKQYQNVYISMAVFFLRQTDMARSTRLLILIKNIYTLPEMLSSVYYKLFNE